jgi:hypothetical protein
MSRTNYGCPGRRRPETTGWSRRPHQAASPEEHRRLPQVTTRYYHSQLSTLNHTLLMCTSLKLSSPLSITEWTMSERRSRGSIRKRAFSYFFAYIEALSFLGESAAVEFTSLSPSPTRPKDCQWWWGWSKTLPSTCRILMFN